MQCIIAALPSDSAHVGSLVATSFSFCSEVETAAGQVAHWNYPHFACTDTKDTQRNMQRNEEEEAPSDGTVRPPSERRISPRRRRPLELAVRTAGFRCLRSREFITSRDIQKFHIETNPSQNRRSNIPVKVNTIMIGGIAAQKSLELRDVLGICPHLILRHIVPGKHQRHGDVKDTVGPILSHCSTRHLTEIEVSWCHFNFDSVRVLKPLLASFVNVTRLTLRDLQINTNGIVMLVECIERMEKLVYLNICRNVMRVRAFPYVLNAVKKRPKIVELWMSDNPMEDATHFADILNSNNALEVIRMRSMKFDANGAEVLRKVVGTPPIREWDLGENAEVKQGCAAVVSYVRRTNGTLRALTMDRCTMTTTDGIDLCRALNPTILTHLNLAFNALTRELGKPLAALLRRSVHLRHLELSGNRMTSVGVVPVLSAMADVCDHVEVLNLAQMKLDDDIALPLARVVRRSRKMRELDISFNFLTTSTVLFLSPSLEFTSAMKILDLRGNDFDDGVFEGLKNATMKAMRHLEYLYLDGNDIPDGKLLHLSEEINTGGMHVVGIGLPDFEEQEGRYRRTIADTVRRRPPGDEDEAAAAAMPA